MLVPFLSRSYTLSGNLLDAEKDSTVNVRSV